MIIGVTGGIATGKSSVTRLFKDLGLPVVNADELAREVVRVGTDTLHLIVERFGVKVLCADGTLNREILSQTIFVPSPGRRLILSKISFSVQVEPTFHSLHSGSTIPSLTKRTFNWAPSVRHPLSRLLNFPSAWKLNALLSGH